MTPNTLDSTVGGGSVERPGRDVSGAGDGRPLSTFRHPRGRLRRSPAGLAGPGLLAHLIVSKFCDHLPLYRCDSMLPASACRCRGVQSADGWRESAGPPRPPWELLRGRVLQSRVIQTDDTPVRVQAQEAMAAHQGRLWVQLGDADHPGLVYLDSSTGRGSGRRRS